MAAPGRALDASATDAFLWDLEADVTEASETIDEEDEAVCDDTARLPDSKRQKLRKCLGMRRPARAWAASRAAPKAESPTSSCEAASPAPKAPPVVKKSPASSAKRRAAAEESDLEEEQRVNALLKERIRRLTEAATIDLVSEEGEEEEGGAGAAEAAAPPAPVVKQAPEEGACGPQAAGGRLKVRVHTAAGESAVLRMGVNEPLSKLFAAFKQHAVQEAWMPSDALPSFWLEGERLSENATAEAAGVEDDDVLDCQW